MTPGVAVPLQDFCRIVQGGRLGLSGNDFVPNGYPAYGAGGLNGHLAVHEFDEPAVILSAIGARCGKCFYVDGKWTSLANTQIIIPDPVRADCKFLWFQLNDERRWHRAGTGQPFIKPSDVKAHRVFLPPLPEQRRIAEVLDRAEALRAKRRAALAQLDTLTQSIFLEMFGDPATNPKGWPSLFLQAVLRMPLRNGVSPSHAGEIVAKVLTLSAITGRGFDETAQKVSTFQRALPPNQTVDENDFLICRGNGNVKLVGRGYFPTHTMSDVAFPDTMIAARVSADKVDRAFLQHVWHSSAVRRQVQSLARTTNGTFKVNQTMLEGIAFVAPPLPLQRDFSRRVAAVEKLRTTHRACIAELDGLCSSLQHRAFRGEL